MFSAVKSAVTSWFSKADPQPAVFGAAIDKHSATIPPMLLALQQYIVREGLGTEGLFRVSGNQHHVKQLVAQINRGDAVTDFKDPLTAATVFKTYFRELPEPLLTYELRGCWLALTELSESESVAKLSSVIAMLPLGHRVTLRFLLETLEHVTRHVTSTQMSAHNLAVVFAPSLLKMDARDPAYSPVAELHELPRAMTLTARLITHCAVLFEGPMERSWYVIGD